MEDIIDKGEGRGALVSAIRDVYHEETGDLICTIRTTTYCRADGGFGGPSHPIIPLIRLRIPNLLMLTPSL